MFKDVNLKDEAKLTTAARGRNGWFRPQLIEVQELVSMQSEGGAEVALAVYSKRQGNEPPIWLRLPADKAIELANVIKDMATIKKEVKA